MTEEEKLAEEYVANKADKGNYDVEQFGKAYFSESSMKQAFIAGYEAGHNVDYRIKPESKKRRMSNLELAKWLAQGNGCVEFYDRIQTWWKFLSTEAENELSNRFKIRIRGWDEEEWHEPLVEE